MQGLIGDTTLQDQGNNRQKQEIEDEGEGEGNTGEEQRTAFG